ncbi:MAG: hypothetical protein R2856_22280 [Caldilineaceae bacterium]
MAQWQVAAVAWPGSAGDHQIAGQSLHRAAAGYTDCHRHSHARCCAVAHVHAHRYPHTHRHARPPRRGLAAA